MRGDQDDRTILDDDATTAKFTVSWHRTRSDACIVDCVAVNLRSRRCSAMHIALHKLLVLVPSKTMKSRDSHRALQKHIASRTLAYRYLATASADTALASD